MKQRASHDGCNDAEEDCNIDGGEAQWRICELWTFHCDAARHAKQEDEEEQIFRQHEAYFEDVCKPFERRHAEGAM